ncbi:MAG TPA: ABC transporter ATP-binding protein [Longimicrobium sp.]
MMPLELIGIRKSFGRIDAVNDVSLRFAPGRVSALIGPNGAGKTTLFNLISGYLRPDAGAIRCYGQRLDGLAPWKVARLGIGRLFQDVRLFGRMTVLDNVLAAFPGQSGERVWRAILWRRSVRVQEESLKERASSLLKSVGLHVRADELAGNLSFGQQKLVALARLLAARADVLLLDEPAAGVAPHLVPQLLGTIRKIANEGSTVVVIEHDMGVVAEVADRVCFMEAGRISLSGTSDEVLRDATVRAAYLGMEALP